MGQRTYTDGYCGTFTIVLMNNAPTSFIPTTEDGVELHGCVVQIKGGNFVQMLGNLTFESALGTPFFFSYDYVERIVAENGSLIWKNRNGLK